MNTIMPVCNPIIQKLQSTESSTSCHSILASDGSRHEAPETNEELHSPQSGLEQVALSGPIN